MRISRPTLENCQIYLAIIQFDHIIFFQKDKIWKSSITNLIQQGQLFSVYICKPSILNRLLFEDDYYWKKFLDREEIL